MVVLLDGVLGVCEAVEGVEDVLEDLGVDVAGPEEVEVLVVRDLGGDCLARQLAQHGCDVDERVAAAVDEHDGRADVARRVFGDLGELARRADAHGLVHVVVVQLEALVADDLEPVHHRLGAGEGVQVRIGGQLLARRHVARLPVEQELQAHVDKTAEQRRIQDRLPHGGRAEDRAAAKHEVENGWGCLHQAVDDAVGEASRRHGGGEADEDVDLVVELRVDGESGKRLRGALREANVGEAGLLRRLEDVLDAVGDIVKRKLVNREVPELDGRGRVVDRLFGVFVAAVVSKLGGVSKVMLNRRGVATHPDVKASLDELKGKTSLLVSEADPNFRVHEQAVVHVDDGLLNAGAAAVDLLALLAALPLEAMQAEKVAIFSLDDMFFCLVAPEAAELYKVGRIANGGRHGWCSVSNEAG